MKVFIFASVFAAVFSVLLSSIVSAGDLRQDAESYMLSEYKVKSGRYLAVEKRP